MLFVNSRWNAIMWFLDYYYFLLLLNYVSWCLGEFLLCHCCVFGRLWSFAVHNGIAEGIICYRRQGSH